MVRLGQGVDTTGVLAEEALVRTFAAIDEYAALVTAHDVARAPLLRDLGDARRRGTPRSSPTGCATGSVSRPRCSRATRRPPWSSRAPCGTCGRRSRSRCWWSTSAEARPSWCSGGSIPSRGVDGHRLGPAPRATPPRRPADGRARSRRAWPTSTGTSTPARCRSPMPRGDRHLRHHQDPRRGDARPARLRPRRIDGAGARRRPNGAYVEWLVAMTVAERLAIPSMHPGRADVIGAGALIWSRVLARAGVDTLPRLRGRHPLRHRLRRWSSRDETQPLPHPVTGSRTPARCHPAPAGPTTRRRPTPGRPHPGAVRRLAAHRRPRRARRPGQRLLGVPAAGPLARGRRARQAGVVRRPALLGSPDRRLGCSDPASDEARLAIVGLAPAANGGNRTGRVFTGDSSGDWLFASLHRVGLATSSAANMPATVSGWSAPGWSRPCAARRPPTSRRSTSATPARPGSTASSPCSRRPSVSWWRSAPTAGTARSARWPEPGTSYQAEAAVRPWGRGRTAPEDGARTPAGLLPPLAAQHLHRPADPAHARRGPRLRPRPRRHPGALSRDVIRCEG